MRDEQPRDVDARLPQLLSVDRHDARPVRVAHDDVVLLDRHLDLVAVDADDLRHHARAGERARDRQHRAVGERAAQDRDVAVQRAVGLDDHPRLDAALLGEQRRVDVGDVLAHDLRQDAFERRESVDADVVRGEFAPHFDVEARQRAHGKTREHLAELLDESDAGAHERVDDASGNVDGVGDEVALERELHRARDRDARLLLRLVGRRTEVRRDHDIRE